MIIQKCPHKGIFYHCTTMPEELQMNTGGLDFAL